MSHEPAGGTVSAMPLPPAGAQGIRHVLVTGGAGFVGSHLVDALLERGYRVRVLDNLSEQVHGTSATRPRYLARRADFVRGDVRDGAALRAALRDIDAVVHLAAAVGVGQSMYEIERYTQVNNVGTAVLLEALIEQPVKRLVVASSMSIYGEGLYRDSGGRRVEPDARDAQRLANGDWELHGDDGVALVPVPTPESKTACPTSVYALSKLDQERLCLIVGQAYGIPTTALRFFNIFGTRQSLSNPYTGVLAIFASRYLNGRAPMVFEDGRQMRDFVHVRDVARACCLALERDAAAGHAINIGSGRAVSVCDIARAMARALGRDDCAADITGRYRVGDIRHCFADISRAEQLLGYVPEVAFADGLAELVAWMQGEEADDRVEHATAELARRGLQR